jgi:hydroxymethylbilane synthase
VNATAALRLGTRASALATTQSTLVAGLLRERLGREVELVEVTTEGDTNHAPLTELGGTGVFVSALREALLDGRIDLAVHSLKDLPTGSAAGVTLAAVPTREDPRDVVVARDGLTLGELPSGSRVGTGSPRRASQLHALGLGLDVADVRGNVDTRIGKVRAGDYDAVVLARAGLARLGRLDDATEVLDPLQMLPAPGQGALAVECRSDDLELAAGLAALEDTHSRSAVDAERAVLHPRGWMLGPDRGPRRSGRGRRRGRAVAQGDRPVPRRGPLRADVRVRGPGRRHGRRDPPGRRDARRRGG